MARTALTIQTITSAGVTPTFTAANVDGHSVPISSRGFVHVKNGGGAPITLTLPTPGTVEGLAIADRTISVAAGAESLFRLTGVLEQPDGSAHVDFSAVTTVTVAAFKL